MKRNYDHIKPLPYKRYHPEVVAVLEILWFGEDSISHLRNFNDSFYEPPAKANTRRHNSDIDLIMFRCNATPFLLQRRGIRFADMRRTLALLRVDVPVTAQYEAVEADLRDMGVLGRVRHG